MSIRAAVSAFIASLKRPGDPYFDNVVLLAHMDGANASTAFADKSKYARTMTAVGSAQLSTAQSAFGGASATFDGTGDAITVAHAAELSVGAQDFTYECRVRFASLATYRAIFSKRMTDAGNGLGEWQCYYDVVANRISIGGNTSAGTAYPIITSSVAPNANQWYALCVEKQGATLRLYLDGVVVGSGTLSGALLTNTAAMVIGAAGNDFGASMNGWIDEIRYTIGVARYKGASYTPSNLPFPEIGTIDKDFDKVVALLHFDAVTGATTFSDVIAGNTWAVAGTGPAHSSTQAKFGQSSMVCTASGTNISSTSVGAKGLMTGDFTVEAWVYIPHSNALNANIVSLGNESSGRLALYMLGTQPAYNSYGNGSSPQFGGTIPRNAWFHLAWAREGSTLRCYIDGTQVGTQTVSGTVGNANGFSNVGGSTNADTYYLDDLRITKGLCRYPGGNGFPVPALPHPSRGYDAIRMYFDAGNGQAVFTDAGNGGSAWSVGSGAVVCSTAVVLEGVSSLFIPAGSTAYLTAAATAGNLLPASKDFSLKFRAQASSWLRPDGAGCYIVSVQDAGSTGAGTQFAIATNSSQFPALVYSDGTTRQVATGSAAIPTNQNLQFELVRTGSTLALKINGGVVVSVTFSGSFPQPATAWRIGAPASAASGPVNGMYFDAFTLSF